MKTASFSQCRRLTVASKKDGEINAFVWDLDYVVKHDEWKVLEIKSPASIPFNEMLGGSSGTLIVWERMDRLGTGPKEVVEKSFNRIIGEAEEHISLVFHRFISGEKGTPKVEICLNGRALDPLDPFNSAHEATVALPVEPLSNGVTMQGFALPHATKYKTREEYEKYGLRGGYQKNQGVYLYRAKRLIIYGTWFNLKKKSNLDQLSRVRIDIGNDHDEDWKIDIKKASAQPPEEVRAAIRNLLPQLNAPSVRVYKRRGAKQTSAAPHPTWNVVRDNESVSYRINREHPIVAQLREELGADLRKGFDAVLSMIESGLPMDSLYVELSNNHEKVEATPMASDEIARLAKEFFAICKVQGQEETAIINVMRAMPVFEGGWETVLKALDIREE